MHKSVSNVCNEQIYTQKTRRTIMCKFTSYRTLKIGTYSTKKVLLNKMSKLSSSQYPVKSRKYTALVKSDKRLHIFS